MQTHFEENFSHMHKWDPCHDMAAHFSPWWEDKSQPRRLERLWKIEVPDSDLQYNTTGLLTMCQMPMSMQCSSDAVFFLGCSVCLTWGQSIIFYVCKCWSVRGTFMLQLNTWLNMKTHSFCALENIRLAETLITVSSDHLLMSHWMLLHTCPAFLASNLVEQATTSFSVHVLMLCFYCIVTTIECMSKTTHLPTSNSLLRVFRCLCASLLHNCSSK